MLECIISNIVCLQNNACSRILHGCHKISNEQKKLYISYNPSVAKRLQNINSLMCHPVLQNYHGIGAIFNTRRRGRRVDILSIWNL